MDDDGRSGDHAPPVMPRQLFVPETDKTSSLDTMLSLTIPPDTTIEKALTEILPDWHAQAVPEGRKLEHYVAVVKIRGRRGGSYTVDVRGKEMKVTKGAAPRRDLWILTDDTVVEYLLRDLSGKHRLVPRSMPEASPVTLMSDPLMVERALASNGVVHFILKGVPDASGDLWVAMGIGKRHVKFIDEQEPDLKLEVPYELYEIVARGKLMPTDALSHPKVKLTGSRMLAMQLALVSTLLRPSDV